MGLYALPINKGVSNNKVNNYIKGLLYMTDAISQIQAQLGVLQQEVKDLRGGYLTINRRYTVTIESLRDLTSHASEAANLSSQVTLKSVSAAKNAVAATSEAVDQGVFAAVDFAAKSAEDAALAAAAAASAAAIAVAHQAEESAILASASAAEASKIASGAAAEAVKISNHASALARSMRTKAD